MSRVRLRLAPHAMLLAAAGWPVAAQGTAILSLAHDMRIGCWRVVVMSLGFLLAFGGLVVGCVGVRWVVRKPRPNITCVAVETPKKARQEEGQKRRLLRLLVENTGDAARMRFTLEGLSGAEQPFEDPYGPPLYWQLHRDETAPMIEPGELEGCVVADLEPLPPGGFRVWPKSPDSEEYDRPYTVAEGSEATITVAFAPVTAPANAQEFRIRCWREGAEIKAVPVTPPS